ncbi:hypothetical protein QL285_062109 [Trifolium repens]|nr:hypothetical protein QL285_062109 [Trifolium repens]
MSDQQKGLLPAMDELLPGVEQSVILGPRGKPILTMLEEIISYLMERWATNREKMSNLQPGEILPNIKKKLDKECECEMSN